jgi:hypothetical protein
MAAVNKGIEMAANAKVTSLDNWKSILLVTHAARKDVKQSLDVISSLLGKKHQLVPDNFGFSLHQLSSTNDSDVVEGMVKLWNEMRADGVLPNFVVDSSFVALFAKKGYIERALQWQRDPP